MKNPNVELLDLMRWNDLDKHSLRELCHCGRTAVYFWLLPPEHRNFQRISDAYMRLLRLELGEARRQRKYGRIGRPA